MQIWAPGARRFAQRPWHPALKFGGLRLSPIPSRGEGRSASRAHRVGGPLGLEFAPRASFHQRAQPM
eukprot:8265197-Alexandrium_andersonii.AAC.1